MARPGIIGAMTERATGGFEREIVCPFLAFEDDREFRASVPDRRHRCFADSPAAPRALAHQAAYCLTGSFTACPTFQDWARRESAPARDEPPTRSLRDTPVSPRLAGRAPGAAAPGGRPPDDRASAGRAQEGTAVPAAVPPSRPARAPGWAAPPPWGMAARTVGEAAGQDRAAAPEGTGEGPAAPEDLAAPEGPAGQGAEQPAGDDLEGVEAGPESFDRERRYAPPPEGDEEAPAFLAGRAAGRGIMPPPPPGRDAVEEEAEEEEEFPDEAFPARGTRADDLSSRPADFQPAAPATRRAPVGYAGLTGSRRTQKEREADPDAPSWERPRRLEAYPAIKTRVGLPAIPRLALVAAIVVLAGLALFAAPFLLRGPGGGDSHSASPSPSLASLAPSAQPSQTPVPAATPLVYVVKKGDTLSGIAKANHVTLDAILKANPKITNANKIKLGDQIVIPTPLPSEIVDQGGGAITPAP